jgi:hypothetical protein
VIVGFEDAGDYETFEATVIADYDARSAVERELVLRLASVLWRLRRATGIETSLFESAIKEPSQSEVTVPSADLLVSRLFWDAKDQSTNRPNNAFRKRHILHTFVRLTEMPTLPNEPAKSV